MLHVYKGQNVNKLFLALYYQIKYIHLYNKCFISYISSATDVYTENITLSVYSML